MTKNGVFPTQGRFVRERAGAGTSNKLSPPVPFHVKFLLPLIPALFLFVSCPILDMAEEYITPSKTIPIMDYDLERYVPIPVSEEKALAVYYGPGLTITAEWFEAPPGQDRKPADRTEDGGYALFVAGKSYAAELTLTPDRGYRFDGETPFAYPDGAVKSLTGDDRGFSIRHVSVTYKETRAAEAISGLDLTLDLPAPVKGKRPKYSFGGARYTGTAEWYAGNMKVDGLFQAGTVYTARVTLVPVTGYAFAENVTVIHSGASPKSVSFTGGDGAAAGVIDFEETAGGGVVVLDYDLRHYVPVPATGTVPVKALDSRADVGVVVVWKDAEEPPRRNLYGKHGLRGGDHAYGEERLYL